MPGPSYHGRTHLPDGTDPIPWAASNSLAGAIADTPDLEAFWKLDELSGTTAFDSGPNGYDLEPRATTSPPTWAAEIFPSGEPAAGFGLGISEHNASVPSFSGDLTALIFFHRDDQVTGAMMGQGFPVSANVAGFQLGVQDLGSGNRLLGVIGDNTGGPHVVVGDSAITTGVHMGVLRRESHIWKVFVDGVIQAASYDDSGTNYDATTGAWIGRSDTSGISQFDGKLSYGAIFSRALTTPEIEAFWEAFQVESSPDGYVLTADGAGSTSFQPPTIEVDSGVVARFKRLILGTGMTGVDNSDDTVTLSVSGGPPTGSAGGDLTGTYPNPTIAAGAVGTSKIAAAAVTTAKMSSGAAAADTVAQADGAGAVSFAARIKSLAKSGATALTGAVTLSGGTNVTLTQTANDISIAASVASMAGASVTLADAGNYFPTDNAEAALQALAAGSVGPTPAIVRLADTTVTGSAAASIDFTSISGSYKHLLLFITGRSDRVATVDVIGLRFNNDSAGNYDVGQVQGNGNPFVVNGSDTIATTFGRAALMAAANATATRSGGGVLFIPDYTGTTFHKGAFGITGDVEGTLAGSVRMLQFTTGWRDASAITRITLLSINGANFVIGTRITLYGLS